MRNFLNKNIIFSKKKFVILQVNLLPELRNLDNFIREIMQFINKYEKNYTFLIPTFTKRFFFKAGKSDFFHKKQKCTNGYFGNYIINSKKGFRSNHATHSYYLIGKDALKLYRKSQFEDGPFEILNKIGISNISFININFKPIHSFHLAENKLGLSKNILSNFLGSYYKSKNRILWSKMKYLNGCDKKYNKLFDKYLKQKIIFSIKLKRSKIYFGKLINVFNKDLKLMEKNFNYFNCKKCFYCKFIHEKNKIIIFKNILKNINIFLLVLLNLIKGKPVNNVYFN